MNNILAAGTPAPDFTLNATPDQTLRLSELRGRPVIIAFYPADWSPVCGDQMALYNEMLEDFREYGAELIGISTARGAMPLSRATASCTFHCSATSSRRVRSRGSIVRTAKKRARASARCSSPTVME